MDLRLDCSQQIISLLFLILLLVQHMPDFQSVTNYAKTTAHRVQVGILPMYMLHGMFKEKTKRGMCVMV